MDPQSLLYVACWSSIFSTANFRALCQPFGEDSSLEGPEYTPTITHLEEAAASGYAWCPLIFFGVNCKLDSRPPPEVEMNIPLTFNLESRAR